MKMFRVDIINLTITEIIIDRETDSCVFINGRRKAKKTDYHVYCYDEYEANLALRKEIEEKYIKQKE